MFGRGGDDGASRLYRSSSFAAPTDAHHVNTAVFHIERTLVAAGRLLKERGIPRNSRAEDVALLSKKEKLGRDGGLVHEIIVLIKHVSRGSEAKTVRFQVGTIDFLARRCERALDQLMPKTAVAFLPVLDPQSCPTADSR